MVSWRRRDHSDDDDEGRPAARERQAAFGSRTAHSTGSATSAAQAFGPRAPTPWRHAVSGSEVVVIVELAAVDGGPWHGKAGVRRPPACSLKLNMLRSVHESLCHRQTKLNLLLHLHRGGRCRPRSHRRRSTPHRRPSLPRRGRPSSCAASRSPRLPLLLLRSPCVGRIWWIFGWIRRRPCLASVVLRQMLLSSCRLLPRQVRAVPRRPRTRMWSGAPLLHLRRLAVPTVRPPRRL